MKAMAAVKPRFRLKSVGKNSAKHLGQPSLPWDKDSNTEEHRLLLTSSPESKHHLIHPSHHEQVTTNFVYQAFIIMLWPRVQGKCRRFYLIALAEVNIDLIMGLVVFRQSSNIY